VIRFARAVQRIDVCNDIGNKVKLLQDRMSGVLADIMAPGNRQVGLHRQIELGIAIPIVYLVTFNLAFATYAFVDEVCDALMVTHGRQVGRVGSFINFQWAVLALANAQSVYLGGWLRGWIRQDVYAPWVVFLLIGTVINGFV
jgi:hypothetical protein